MARFATTFHLTDWDRRLVTSPFVTPRTLFVIRFILAIWAVVSAVVDGIIALTVMNRGIAYYSFFTRMAWVGVTSYFCAAAFHSGGFVLSMRKRDRSPSYPLERWHTILKFLHLLLYATVTSFPMVVTPVYWALLTSPKTFLNTYETWSNISFHLLNAVVILVELFISRMPLYWVYSPFLLLIGGGYIGMAYVSHAAQGVYPYPFLDPANVGNKLPLYIVGIAASSQITFLISWSITRLRDRLFPNAKGLADLGVHPLSSEERMTEVA